MNKTILFEGRNLTLSKGTGIATYARNLTRIARDLGYVSQVLVGTDQRLPRNGPLSEIALYDARRQADLPATSALRSYLRGLIPVPFGIRTQEVANSGFVVRPQGANLLDEFDKVHAAFDLFERADQHVIRFGTRAKVNLPEKPDIFHATHPTPLMVRGAVNVYTIHDLVPLRLPYTTLDKKNLFLTTVSTLARDADHIVTVSEFSRQEIVRFLKVDENKVTNTYQAVGLPAHLTARPDADIDEDLAHIFGLDRQGYFLFFGALEPKKNVGTLIDAYAASGTKRPLIIAGGLGWQYDGDLAKIEDPRFLSYRIEGGVIRSERQVRRYDHLPFSQLVSLIRGARGVLFPSLYEGFGLPVLETMLLGTPVMTSNVSSLPEVAGDAAILVDPYNVETMSRAIRSLDRDNDLIQDLSTRGKVRAEMFSPERYRQRVADLYSGLLR